MWRSTTLTSSSMLFAAVLLLVEPGRAQPQEDFDIVIYGATPGGIAAALTAVRGGSNRVALVEPSKHIGGMSAAGGIGLRDIGNEAYFNGTGREWAMLNSKKYNRGSTPVWQPDMTVANESFWQMLNAAGSALTVVLDHPLLEQGGVRKSGTQIQAIGTSPPSGGPARWFGGKQFIDASYDADVVVAAGASYTFGREARSQYNESLGGRLAFNNYMNFGVPVDPTNHTDGKLLKFVNSQDTLVPEGGADDRLMGFSYRLCLSSDPSNQVNFSMPENYNADDFALLRRYLEALVTTKTHPTGPTFEQLFAVLQYRNGPSSTWDLCDGDGAVTSDAVTLNEGYVQGDRATKQRIVAAHRYYLQGLLWFLASDTSVPPTTRQSTHKYGLCRNAYPELGHWPPQIYIREGVRLVGDHVLTQNDLVGGRCTNASVGLATWGMDVHVVNRIAVKQADGSLQPVNEGETKPGGTPIPGPTSAYELPYWVLLPKRSELSNLLVPVCPSTSHVAFSSVRVEPHFMVLGQASATAALLAIERSVAVQDVDIKELQRRIQSQGTLIHWPETHCP